MPAPGTVVGGNANGANGGPTMKTVTANVWGP
jgi:hypothetical protein